MQILLFISCSSSSKKIQQYIFSHCSKVSIYAGFVVLFISKGGSNRAFGSSNIETKYNEEDPQKGGNNMGYIDGLGIWRESGEGGYDSRGIYRAPGEGGYDANGVFRCAGEGGIDYAGVYRNSGEGGVDKSGTYRSGGWSSNSR